MIETEKIWLDGKLVPWAEAQVHVLTHTLHYGLGVFEGIRCYKTSKGAAVFRLEEHVDRLFDSAHICQIAIPFTRRQIVDAILETIRVNRMEACYIRPIAFVGYGEMGIYAPKNPIRLAVAVWPWGAYLGEEGLAKGIRVKFSSFTRHHVNVSPPRAKAVGYYINSILAKREVKAAGFDEAILLDPEGYVAEGSGENIFIVRKGALKTTPLTSILEGITRDTVLALARERGIAVREERFTRDELYIAEEAFLTGTAAEITPIREVDDRQIGRGEPGPITRQLQEAFFAIVRGEDDTHRHWLTLV